MGNGESVQSNPHFTDPYGGHLRSPNDSEEMFYPDNQSYFTNNGYHKQTNKSIKGSSPKSNRFEDTISPGHSFTDFPHNPSNRKYSDLDFEEPSSLPKNSPKPRRTSSMSVADINSDAKNTKRLSRQPYYSIWSIKCSESLSPQPRIGHFYATAPGSSKTYIGFGRHEIDSNSNGAKENITIPTNEIWEFDHKSFLWRRIALHGINIKEREESVATAIMRNPTSSDNLVNSTIIYVFGGKDKSHFYSDLLMIDTLSGTITALKSKHNPPNLAGAFISYYNNKIFVWGGYDKNGNLNQTLFIYDIQGNNWTSKLLENVPGRCNASSVTTKSGKMLIYGGQKGETGLLEIDLNNLTAQILPTSGLAPIPDYNYGRLLLVKETYLFYFGGKANNKYTMLYTLDLKRNWWFVFYIKPDNETVTIREGKINDNGLFLIPRIHSFGCCYSEENDSIVAFLGHPQNEPPPLFILYMGEAFGFINLRDDMLTIMNQDPGDPNDEEVPIDLNC